MSNCGLSKGSTRTKCSRTRTSSCKECLVPSNRSLKHALGVVRKEYRRGSAPWVIGFSGGKDSSALLKIVYKVISEIANPKRDVTIVYCDTGVEIPTMNVAVLQSLSGMAAEARKAMLPISVHVAKPRLQDRYFVKVIGRGYPPPTNKFRWCTDRLRINPVQQLLKSSIGPRATILLGTRWSESPERARTMRRHKVSDADYFFRQSKSGHRIFAPIVDFTLNDVWRTIFDLPEPKSIDAQKLADLYKDAGAECPVFREEKGTPCGTGRFGCWTCTVVRKDKAVRSLIEEGYSDLKPLFNFRNWLADIRDKPEFRCPRRRNGMPGPGPFTLDARKRILNRLRSAQRRSKIQLIDDVELREIFRLWRMDRQVSGFAGS